MEQITIVHAAMRYTKEDGYIGTVQFAVEGHRNEYEMALQSKRGSEWGYGLFFLNGSGNEEQLLALEEQLEDNDALFDFLVQSAKERLEQA